MLTATEITDEQIRALREDAYRAYWKGDMNQWDTINLCRLALVAPDPALRGSSRYRCAKILNARAAKERR